MISHVDRQNRNLSVMMTVICQRILRKRGKDIFDIVIHEDINHHRPFLSVGSFRAMTWAQYDCEITRAGYIQNKLLSH